MKSIKFLAALAVPAMFAACTNEELAPVQQEVQQGQEFVGAELIGKGISFNVGSESESRISAAGKWTGKDKLGLGWIVKGNYSDTQTEADPDNQNFFGNHLFYYNEETDDFETMANIYTGWHFAYFPFTHMPKLGEIKTVTVNPVQKEDWETDRFNTCLQLTARAFLSPANLDEETYQLKDVRFDPVRAFNTIGINIQPNETFTKNSILSDLKVKSIKLNVGASVFMKEVELNPTFLATMKYDEDGNYSKSLTTAAVRASLKDVLKRKGSLYNSTTTNVENASINLAGDQYLRIHTMPATAVINPKNVVFTINVDGGVFTVPYITEPEEDDAVAKNNNEVIEKLVAAYAKNGAMTQVGGVLYEDMNLQLTADMFEPVTDAINSEEMWNHVVKVVSVLGKKDVTFNIVEGEDGPWSFTDVDGDGNLINLPEGANVTVTGENMILAAEGNWPAEGLTVTTGVVVNANLTVADNVVMTATDGIVNNAIITGGYKSKIKDVENNAEIKVIYGTFVTVANDKYGVISYDVPAIGSLDEAGKELTEARIQQRVEYLVDREFNTAEFALVNKLNVNKGVSLNLSKQTVFGSAGAPSDEDLYRPSTPGNTTQDEFKLIPSLNVVSLEINGGTVTSTLPATLVKAVVNGGTLSNVSLTDGLKATESTITATSIKGGVEATESTITAETIEGGLKAAESTINAKSIKGGVEASESEVTAETIEGGLTATESTITAEKINGAVVLKGAATINNAEITDNVTVETGTTSLNNVNINGTLTIKAGAKVIISGNDAKITHIDNYGKLTTNVNVYTETVEIFSGSEAVVAKNMTIWYNTPSYGEFGYTQQGKTDGSILYRNLAYIKNAEELATVLTSNVKKIDVLLTEDIDLPIASLGSQTPGSGEYKLGGEATETININLNGNKLNITTTYWSAIGAKNDDATITIKNGTMTSSQATGTWNSYDVTFANCNYVIENVIFDKAVAFTNANKSVEMNKVVINETHDYYAIWISAKGQNVKIDGLTVNSDGRGIKIDEQYVGTPEKVTLNVLNASFRTNNKAAIMVKSAAGADITLSNINISGVQADKVNAVWVDEDSANYSDLVSVNGGTKINE